MRAVYRGLERAKAEINAAPIIVSGEEPPFSTCRGSRDTTTTGTQHCAPVGNLTCRCVCMYAYVCMCVWRPTDYGIIVCAMRFFTREMSGYFANFIDLHFHDTPRRLQGTLTTLAACIWY